MVEHNMPLLHVAIRHIMFLVRQCGLLSFCKPYYEGVGYGQQDQTSSTKETAQSDCAGYGTQHQSWYYERPAREAGE
jgi:hypothetical protein